MGNDDPSAVNWATEKVRAETDQIRASIEAERAKTASAVRKDEAEIAILRAPFYRKAGFWTTVVPVFTATVTVFFYLNNQFNADFAKLKSDLEASQSNYRKAQVDLADFKNTQAGEQLREVEAQKSAIAKQIADANNQLDTLQKQLDAKTQLAGDSPIIKFIDSIAERTRGQFAQTSWDEALHENSCSSSRQTRTVRRFCNRG